MFPQSGRAGRRRGNKRQKKKGNFAYFAPAEWWCSSESQVVVLQIGDGTTVLTKRVESLHPPALFVALAADRCSRAAQLTLSEV